MNNDTPVRQSAIFGCHGLDINVTDGDYLYIRAPANDQNAPLFNYTLMPTRPQAFFQDHMLTDATLERGFSFTRGMPLLKCASDRFVRFVTGAPGRNLLFDIRDGSYPVEPKEDADREESLCRAMVNLMETCESPPEQYERMGLEGFR
jgi:hypothetical protein